MDEMKIVTTFVGLSLEIEYGNHTILFFEIHGDIIFSEWIQYKQNKWYILGEIFKKVE